MERKGLSILIPVYNYEVSPLVRHLHKQAKKLDLAFEIRCYDDDSAREYKRRNRDILVLNNVVYQELKENVGRSRIRNILAEEAAYDHILFIDGDSRINKKSYVENYLIASFSHDVVMGGTVYCDKLKNPDFALRWKYGKSREELPAAIRNRKPYLNFTLNNLFIKRELFLQYQLDESIRTYGHEDTKFGFMLKNNGIRVKHIDNPVEHIGLETNEQFLLKTRESVKNLYKLSLQNFGLESKLYHTHNLLERTALNIFFRLFYRLFDRKIQRNLQSKDPNLFYFDLYKLNLMVKESKKAA